MPSPNKAVEFLARPGLKHMAVLCIALSLCGFAYFFKASNEIIPKLGSDRGYLVWDALKTQQQFEYFRSAVRLYDATQDPTDMDNAMLWLDSLYSRLGNFPLANWKEYADQMELFVGFQEALHVYLDEFDKIITQAPAVEAPLFELMSEELEAVDNLITSFILEQQVTRQRNADARTANAKRLLFDQQILLAAVLLSISILFLLVWSRSRQSLWLSQHDVLTGLGNRSAVFQQLAAIKTKNAMNSEVALHCIDLDRFKMINDTLGHERGDDLLKRFARRLEAMSGKNCFVARTGGDQFVVLQREVMDTAAAMQFAHKVVFSATNEFMLGEHRLRVGVSIGVAIASECRNINKSLLEHADLALYEAKRRGGNNVTLFDPALQERADRHRRIDNDLRKALENSELVNFYQPKIDLKTGLVCGAEALLRWFHPEHGMIPPDHFIPIAEDTRLIIPIGSWVANQACADCKTWSQMTDGHFHIAVNVSPVQFESDMLVSEVRRALKNHDLDPSHLELEITESTLMDESRQVNIAMRRLRDLGVSFALDDFGTGYSSLSYLDRFRFSKVKIDRSFVMGLNPQTRHSPIVEAVVHMGRGYGFSVCAEGIEDVAHATLLAELGCDEAQGYYFGKPMKADDFTQYLADHLNERKTANETATVGTALLET